MIEKQDKTKIEEAFKSIFKTEIENNSNEQQYTNLNGIVTIVKEPIVKHQIIQLAKLCKDLPLSMTLKSSAKGIFIEFWN